MQQNESDDSIYVKLAGQENTPMNFQLYLM